MDDMTILIIVIYFLLFMFDNLVISDARCLLLDFLIGQRNMKNANKIHKQQTLRDRITMSYILPMLKKNTKAFRIFHRLYMILLIALIPQYIILIFTQIFVPQYLFYVFGFFLLIKFILGVYYRLELGSPRMSVYAQKK